MDMILLDILILVAAFYLGWAMHRKFTEGLNKDIFKRLGIRPADIDRAIHDIINEQKLPENFVEIRVEPFQSGLAAYEVGTDAFLGQASTAEDLREVIQSNMRGRRFCISDENGAALLGVERL